VIFFSEYYSIGYKKICFVIAFILINEWTVLEILRLHYVIDFLTGFCFARMIHVLSEYLCWIPDVLIRGIPK